MIGRITNGLFGPASALGRLGFRWKFVRSRRRFFFFFYISRRAVVCQQFGGQLHVGHERSRTLRKRRRRQINKEFVFFVDIKSLRAGFTQHAAYSFYGLVQLPPRGHDDNDSIQCPEATAGTKSRRRVGGTEPASVSVTSTSGRPFSSSLSSLSYTTMSLPLTTSSPRWPCRRRIRSCPVCPVAQFFFFCPVNNDNDKKRSSSSEKKATHDRHSTDSAASVFVGPES